LSLVLAPMPVSADSDPSDDFDVLVLTVRLRDLFPPVAVTNLVASPGALEGEINLAWTAPFEDNLVVPSLSPTTLYTVRLATFSAVLTGSSTAWWNGASDVPAEPAPQAAGLAEGLILNSLEPGNTFWFGLKSEDELANVSPIDELSVPPAVQATAVAPDFPPAAPSNLIASPGSSAVTLSWDASPATDLDFYRIYVDSITPYDFADAYTLVVDSATTGYLHSGLTTDVTYYYRVTAVDKGAPTFAGFALESAPSNTILSIPSGVLPNPPTLIPNLMAITSSQLGWILNDNATNENGLYVTVSTAGGGVGRLSTNLGPLASSGSFVGFTETALTPNTGYTRYGEAANTAGSSFSPAVTRYTLANPPTNTQVVSVGSNTITLSWALNGNPVPTQFEVEYDTAASFAAPVSGGIVTVNAVAIANLTPGTTYFLRLRARNGDGIATAYDTAVSTVTLPPSDFVVPQAPYGMWAEWVQLGSQGHFRVHWRPVAWNTDGTAFSDPANERYKVYRSENYPPVSGDPAWATWTTNSLQWEGSLNPDKMYYYRLRALDVAGNESADSVLLEAKGDGSVLNVVTMADDGRSRAVLPADTLAKALLSENNGFGEDLYVRGLQVPAEEKGRVVRSIVFSAHRVSTGEMLKDFMLKPANASMQLGYEVQNGQVMQGAPRGAGAAMIPAAQAADQLALFWNNGVEWTKIGGAVNLGSQRVEAKTGRLGRYQVRQATRIGPVSLTRVYPRVFTPNGDGWNDKVVFQFDNPGQENIKGEIFDLSGSKVTDMLPGPNPDSSLLWDGRSGGSLVPGGIYFYQIEAGGEKANGTVVVAQ